MAKSIWLVTKTLEPGQEYINGVTAVVINADDGDSASVIIQEAVDQANKSEVFTPSNGNMTGNLEIGGTENVFPPKYFDTAVKISDLSGGPIAADKAAYVFRTLGVTGVIAP